MRPGHGDKAVALTIHMHSNRLSHDGTIIRTEEVQNVPDFIKDNEGPPVASQRHA